jgi:Putative beta-barrel porin 2
MVRTKLTVTALAAGFVGVLAVGGSRSAHAQAQDAVEGHGYEVSPGTVLHPNLGAELGFINNLFYDDSNIVSSGLIRLTARFDVASAKVEPEEPIPDEEPGNEPAPPTFEFRAGGGLRYEEYLYYGNVSAAAQRNLAFDTQAHLQVYPQGTWSFLADDRLQRDIRPRNFEDGSSTNRIDNLLDLGLRYQPGGHTISGTLRYRNMTDVFEGASGVPNRMDHTLGLRGDWQWLPYTRLFADVSYGFFGALGSAGTMGFTKNSSNPLRGLVGIATTLTEPLTLKAQLGWAWMPYDDGVSHNAPIFDLEVGYEYLPTGRVVGEYSYDAEDSTNADYYRDHKFALRVEQQLIDKLLLSGSIDLRLRGYRGVDPVLMGGPTRDDFVFGGHARAQYVLTERYYVTGEYTATVDQTNFRYTSTGPRPRVGDDPGYVRHEVMFGARAAF